MSTKSTIASGPEVNGVPTFWIEEEMIAEVALLVVHDPALQMHTTPGNRPVAELLLTPEIIEAIVKAHAEERFPHQREPLDPEAAAAWREKLRRGDVT